MGNVREPQKADISDTRAKLERFVLGRLFAIAYQPIVDLGSGQVVACEALARPAPESGFPHPGALLEAAAAAGLTWDVECALRGAALQGAAQFEHGVSLFINCSPGVFTDARFADSLASQTKAAGVDPTRVVIEVTEAAEACRDDEMTAQVARVKAMGFAVAIDDVGAGTSGLSRIVSLRPDWLKLDRGLIQNIHNDEFRKNLVRFFGHFARLSGVRVIAEGIENLDELAAVASLGVRFCQGYLFAYPGTIASVLSPEHAADIASSCAKAWQSMPDAPGRAGLRRLIQPARSAQAVLFAGEAAGELMREPAIEGLAVFDGRRVLGWISREDVLAAARAGGKKLLGACVRPAPSVAAPEMSLAEAIELLCMRADSELANPLIVVDDGELAGIVRSRDLLRTLSRQNDRANPAAVLPGYAGRAAADRHIGELLARAGSHVGSGFPVDAMIVDVQGMADFNAAYGYELGDVVIQALGESVRTVYPSIRPAFFSAHLGDDRFIVVGPAAGDLTDLHLLERAFADRTSSLLVGDDPHATDTVLSVGRENLRLRFLVINDLATRIQSARELPAVERQLRDRIRAGGGTEPVGTATLVTDRRDSTKRRLSA